MSTVKKGPGIVRWVLSQTVGWYLAGKRDKRATKKASKPSKKS